MTLPRLSGSRFQCVACGHHFAGPQAYGMHFGDDAQCMTAEQMRAAMTVNGAGFWTIERSASPDHGTSAHRGAIAALTRSQGAA
jgi:hypothetical protein